MCPARERLARLDMGFDSNEIMEVFEEEKAGYVIKMRCLSVLGVAIPEIPRKRWKRISDEDGKAEITVFHYQASSWSRPRRVVVVRRMTDEGSQRSFWVEWRYSYSAYVTNLNWTPLDIYRFYNHRGNAEKLIKEGKYGFGIDQIPTGDFFPNWANLLLKLIAYNIMLLFQKAPMPNASSRLTAATFHRLFVTIPAQLVHRGGRWILKLAELYAHQAAWWNARRAFAPSSRDLSFRHHDFHGASKCTFFLAKLASQGAAPLEIPARPLGQSKSRHYPERGDLRSQESEEESKIACEQAASRRLASSMKSRSSFACP